MYSVKPITKIYNDRYQNGNVDVTQEQERVVDRCRSISKTPDARYCSLVATVSQCQCAGATATDGKL